MGWDQNDTYETPQHFLARHCGVDLDKVVADAIANAMAEKGLTLVSVDDVPYSEDDFGFYIGQPKTLTLSDGSVFVHRVVSREVSDDWGSDYYEFRLPDEEIKEEVINYCDE